MAYTKRQIVAAAMAEIGFGPYAYDIQPEDWQSGLDALNGVMAAWGAQGASVGYPVANAPGADDLDSDSGIGAPFVRGAICALAAEIAPSYGKTISQQTAKSARMGLMLAQRRAVQAPARALDNMAVPAGAGNKLRSRATLSPHDTDILEGERND